MINDHELTGERSGRPLGLMKSDQRRSAAACGIAHPATAKHGGTYRRFGKEGA